MNEELIKRRRTKEVFVGKVKIGGDAPVRVQSMTSTKTEDVKGTLEQIFALKDAGCELVRIAVPSINHVKFYKEIKNEIGSLPLIADCHFDPRTALKLIDIGADKVRINPGNIVRESYGGKKFVKELFISAKKNDVPIRIGVNSGSLEKELLEKYKYPRPEAIVESALQWVKFAEDLGFEKIIVSLKSSNVPECVSAYRKFSEKSNYPLHLGITEAGPSPRGMIRSAIGIGILLSEGIGDTIRVSLTDSPVKEVEAAWEILRSLNIRTFGPNLIACPTCGRCKVDLIQLTKELEKRMKSVKKSLTVAVMGCEVNGPGEAGRADIGIAAGSGKGILFKKGKILKIVREEEMLSALMEEIEKYDGENETFFS